MNSRKNDLKIFHSVPKTFKSLASNSCWTFHTNPLKMINPTTDHTLLTAVTVHWQPCTPIAKPHTSTPQSVNPVVVRKVDQPCTYYWLRLPPLHGQRFLPCVHIWPALVGYLAIPSVSKLLRKLPVLIWTATTRIRNGCAEPPSRGRLQHSAP